MVADVTNTVIGIQGNAVKSGTPSDGQVLTWVAANSDWEAKVPNAAGLTAPVIATFRSETTNYTIDSTASDYLILADTSSGAITLTLPAPSSGRVLVVKDKKGTANSHNITIAQHASEKIDGTASSLILSANWGTITLISDGTDWYTV